MRLHATLFLGVGAVVVRGADPVGPTQPWGLHVAYGADPATSLTVGWSTRDPVPASVVRYGAFETTTANSHRGSPTPPLDLVAYGNATTFQPPGSAAAQDLHLVALTGLAPNTRYAYTVGSDPSGAAPNASSAVFTFTTAPADPQGWHPTLAVFGDMGVTANAQATLAWLLKDLDAGAVDFVAHIGDHGYNLEDDAGARGDAFMVQQQPLAARVPYHVGPGNHEEYDDYSHYRGRLGSAMPLAEHGAPSGGGQGIFHSVDFGQTHFCFVSSEVYFVASPHGMGLLKEQRAWLAADLAAVNRTRTPWVAIGLHQPFYCSPNDDGDPCHKPEPLNPPRDGYPGHHGQESLGLEALAYEFGVDVVFGAHEHAYERFYPVYQSAWDEARTGPSAYVNYDAPVNILTGAAGCSENMDIWQNESLPFSALRVQDYGYSRFQAVNLSHARVQYVDNARGAVLDDLWLVRDQHGPFGR